MEAWDGLKTISARIQRRRYCQYPAVKSAYNISRLDMVTKEGTAKRSALYHHTNTCQNNKAFLILDYIMKECAIMEQQTDDRKLRLQILSLMKDIERSKLDLLADTTIAKEIIRDWKQKQEKLLSKQLSSGRNVTEGNEEEQEDKETETLETIDDMGKVETEEGPDPEE